MAPRKWGAIIFSGGSFAHPALPALVVRDGQEDLPPPSAVSAHGITLCLPGPGSAGFDWITTPAYPRRLPPTPVPLLGKLGPNPWCPVYRVTSILALPLGGLEVYCFVDPNVFLEW